VSCCTGHMLQLCQAVMIAVVRIDSVMRNRCRLQQFGGLNVCNCAAMNSPEYFWVFCTLMHLQAAQLCTCCVDM
jgi:hypothetical protein